jgi:hypothetical protein
MEKDDWGNPVSDHDDPLWGEYSEYCYELWADDLVPPTLKEWKEYR